MRVNSTGLTVFGLQGTTVPFLTQRRVMSTKESRNELCLGTLAGGKSVQFQENQAGFLEVVTLQADLGSPLGSQSLSTPAEW